MKVRAGKKREEEHVNSERWLVSYADLLTLLFALFVVMYAMSQADRAKFQAVAQSMKEAFSGAPPRPGGGKGFPGGGGSPSDTHSGTPSDTVAPQVGEFSEMRTQIAQELEAGDLSDKVVVDEDNRGLIVRFAAEDFFAPGDSVVRSDMQPLLERIGRVLSTTEHQIRVEGHTDPSEAKSPGYLSDWELASARATWVVKFLIRRFGMDPVYLSAVSYSHFRPLSEGSETPGSQDDLSRGKNRRVEIIVLSAQTSGS